MDVIRDDAVWVPVGASTIRSLRPERLALALTLVACGGSLTPPLIPARPRLTLGDTAQGTITSDDPEEEVGQNVDSYEVTLPAHHAVRIGVRSEAFDPWLRVVGPDGWRAEDDDALPGMTDSMVQLTTEVAGTYVVTVATALPRHTGAYTLEVSEALASERTLTLGTVEDDVIDSSPHRFFDFDGLGGSIAEIRVVSPSIATSATVMGPRGERWTNDGPNELVIPLPRSGRYTLVVSGLGGAQGAFRIESHVRAPITTAHDAPAGPFAGPRGAGRVLGLYVGISAYTSLTPLYGAADDARLLGEAMRAAHLQSANEQTILLDEAATRAEVLRALRDLAQRATAEDVVIVFFAGHGDQQPVPPEGDPRELDGLDEVIMLLDGPLLDGELARALEPMSAAIAILALDSCHSGGFADDFITRPNRVGLFSSEEDAISDTAEAHRAGGYLSWHLRRGVLGEADVDPHDGALYLGELTDHVYRGFVRDESLINPIGMGGPPQHPVIRRGAVAWSSILWPYPRASDLALPGIPDVSLESAAP